MTIFASFSMPDYVLIDLIKNSIGKQCARGVQGGLKEGVEKPYSDAGSAA
uniref:IncF plasmid conjugative transfer pilus assembly protein TraW n=1 Tax=Klebsiella pneumoniae TaxID=573 RepID=A0A8B0SSQ7_KLEPN|nr:IncF plasmid conjugative transfer pilus assembly protein TraW [Klebsiella pneumoniae]